MPSRASGFIQALQKRQRNLRLQSAGNIKHTVLEESNSSSVPPFFINPLYTTDNDHILPACLQPKRVSHDCQLSQRQPPKNSAVFTKDNQELQNSAELSNKTVQTITPAPFIMNLDSNNLRDLLSHYNFRLKEIDGKLGEANVDFVNGELIRYNGKIVQVITQLPPRPNPHTKQIGKPTIPPLPPQWALRLVTRKHNKRKKKKSDVTEKPIHFADIKEAMQYQADLWVKVRAFLFQTVLWILLSYRV